MFQNLSNKLNTVFEKLRKRGMLNETDVDLALREIRLALLEADVALPVVRSFIQKVKERAVGEEVVKSVTPGQMVVKIVNDVLIDVLGGEEAGSLDLKVKPPVPVLLVGLQGAGKTTTCAKLAKFLKDKQNKRVLMVSLDVQRPAAREQLKILGQQIDVASFPIDKGNTPEAIAKLAMEQGRLEGYDIVLLDTAGRLHIDDDLMDEVNCIKDLSKPQEVLLVADAMTGQDAATVAKSFQEKVGLTGIILTRMDGDARGGAALSMRMVAGKPIKFMGVGEKTDQLEPFVADRVAGRILDMGDIVGLVERAAQTISQEDTEHFAKRMEEGKFDLEDMRMQLKQMNKMGGFGALLGMMPGMGKLKSKLGDAGVDEKMVARQVAIIQSMTLLERRRPEILNASRKRRVAAGSGVQAQDVNRLLKQWKDMSAMMKKFKKLGKKGLMRQGLSALMPK